MPVEQEVGPEDAGDRALAVEQPAKPPVACARG
jgi:hypothetical protein